jgi:hypothetical protein
MFAEIREDLDHVQATTFGGRDEFRLVRTKQELNGLQNDLAAHRYSEARLDGVVATMQRVVADNRMPPRDREMLRATCDACPSIVPTTKTGDIKHRSRAAPRVDDLKFR